MLVKDVKPIGRIGKDLLENKDAKQIIETIIEKPLQKACMECKEKNIETVMSSANKNNLVKKNKKRINKKEILEDIEKGKIRTFLSAGKGYGWLMLNYNTLSDENKEIVFSLEKELGEDTIWFLEPTYVEVVNPIRQRFGFKILDIDLKEDKYKEEFEKRKLRLMYSNIYPRKSVFIRMPIEENTQSEEVEEYFSKILSRLKKQ